MLCTIRAIKIAMWHGEMDCGLKIFDNFPSASCIVPVGVWFFRVGFELVFSCISCCSDKNAAQFWHIYVAWKAEVRI